MCDGRGITECVFRGEIRLFDIGGKVKIGHDLTSKDRKEFDKAAAVVPCVPADEAYGAGSSRLPAPRLGQAPGRLTGPRSAWK